MGRKTEVREIQGEKDVERERERDMAGKMMIWEERQRGEKYREKKM